MTTTNYLFKWGDGTANTSTVNQFASHTYTVAGDYRLQVDISLSNGQTLHVQYDEYFYADDGPLLLRRATPEARCACAATTRRAYAYAYLTNNTGCLHAGQPISFGALRLRPRQRAHRELRRRLEQRRNVRPAQHPRDRRHGNASTTRTRPTGTYPVTVRAKDNDGGTYEDLRRRDARSRSRPTTACRTRHRPHQPDQPQTGKTITFDASYSYDLDGTRRDVPVGLGPERHLRLDRRLGHPRVRDRRHALLHAQGHRQPGRRRLPAESRVQRTRATTTRSSTALYISQTQADTARHVFFNASGYDDDGTIAQYQWDWTATEQLDRRRLAGRGRTSTRRRARTTRASRSSTTTAGPSSSPATTTYTVMVTAAVPSAQRRPGRRTSRIRATRSPSPPTARAPTARSTSTPGTGATARPTR